MDHMSADAVGFVESFARSDGGNAAADGEAKLFKDEKLGVGKPKGGNAPKGGIEGNPSGRPQGRSKSTEVSHGARASGLTGET